MSTSLTSPQQLGGRIWFPLGYSWQLIWYLHDLSSSDVPNSRNLTLRIFTSKVSWKSSSRIVAAQRSWKNLNFRHLTPFLTDLRTHKKAIASPRLAHITWRSFISTSSESFFKGVKKQETSVALSLSEGSSVSGNGVYRCLPLLGAIQGNWCK